MITEREHILMDAIQILRSTDTMADAIKAYIAHRKASDKRFDIDYAKPQSWFESAADIGVFGLDYVWQYSESCRQGKPVCKLQILLWYLEKRGIEITRDFIVAKRDDETQNKAA